MGKIIDFLKQLPDEQYIAVGAKNGSGFYFIGPVSKYKTRIPRCYWEREILDGWERDIPGEPKTLAILVEGEETGALWTLAEADSSFKRKPKIINMQALHTLREGIALAACKQFELLLSEYDREDDEIMEFFKSDWGELITGADGQKIIDVCRIRARYKVWRKSKGCFKCKISECIHNSGSHFIAFEKGDKTCLKKETLQQESE